MLKINPVSAQAVGSLGGSFDERHVFDGTERCERGFEFGDLIGKDGLARLASKGFGISLAAREGFKLCAQQLRDVGFGVVDRFQTAGRALEYKSRPRVARSSAGSRPTRPPDW